MSISVKWSDQLELLADGLFDEWRKQRSVFRKVCVVVHDMATRDWLKSYYLMGGKSREVLMNMDFVPLPEFVNNWLFAKTHDEPLDSRKPNAHPYAKPVLTWRIYRILSDKAALPVELHPLLEYIGNDEKNAPRRRYALAQQIAKLYDDYLNSRFAMLLNWESSNFQLTGGVPAWQPVLYRLLTQEESGTYASDYNSVLFHDIAKKAVDNGFPDYSSIHVFDIPDMPEPTFHLLEKISEDMEVTFWTFNPCGDWLADTPTKRDAIREMVMKTRNSLKNGDIPPSFELDGVFDNPQERLLGALGTGGRAIIGAEVDYFSDSPDVKGEPNTAFANLENANISIHSCFSPRRELEAIRSGLHDFFKNHEDAKPRDAIVLCGDWNTYAPIVNAVFSTDQEAEGYIPMTIAGGIPEDTPLTRSFSDLMAFRDNRFEISAVFALLGVPDIRSHFNLDELGVQTLRDMAQNANIHWGLDDDDVNTIIGEDNAVSYYPYTWRRGLDRMALDMLYGPLADDETLVQAGSLGELRPCGTVESDRAQLLKDLNRFIDALSQLRKTLKEEKMDAELWQTKLLDIVSQFYEEDDGNLGELKKIRQAIQSVHDSALTGGMMEPIEGDVFISAVLSNIKNILSGSRTPADSVLFAPLKSASATPHRFVWICGLNDGSFPRIEHRPSFDIIGRHPSLFDVTSRDRDGFALLKAALSAHDHLALSYVGHNIRTNDPLPPSVLLNELKEYLNTLSNNNIHEYSHPLQGYSLDYFRQDGELPPSYSASDQAVAQAIYNREVAQEAIDNLTAFTLNPEGDTVIPAEELADFFATPNVFLIKRRLGLNIQYFNGLDDDDCQLAKLDKHQLSALMLNPPDNDIIPQNAKVLVENGNAPDVESAEAAINGTQNEDVDEWRNYPLKFGNSKNGSKKEFTCDNTTVVGAYKQFLEEAMVSDEQIMCSMNGHNIRIPFHYRRIELQTQVGPLEHVFCMEDAKTTYNSSIVRAWVLHVVGHAAGCKFATILFSQKMPAKSFRPLEQEEAIKKLNEYLAMALNPLPQNYPDFDKTNKADDEPFIPLPQTINTNKR